jgi:2Fe-2S ferredoxin
MPRIVFIDRAGLRHEVSAPAGHTVMEAAVDNGIPGILAECGGACACATCHAFIEPAWVDRLPAPDDMEDAMLDTAADRRANSRLTCQIELHEALDGLTLVVAGNES